MAKAEFTVIKKPYRGQEVGSKVMLGVTDAKVLLALGRVSGGLNYQTRVMTAAPRAPAAGPLYRIKTLDGVLTLDDMEAAALHELAKRLEVPVHHASGAAKVRAALMEAFPVTADPAE